MMGRMSKYGEYEILATLFNTLILVGIVLFFVARIAGEASYNIASDEFVKYHSLLPANILSGSGYLQVFTAVFITLGYWEVFIYIFFIVGIARSVEKSIGTVKLARLFLESYIIFITFSYLFFPNFRVHGLWFYVFNIMWFYLQNQSDRRWFKYGYPLFCVIFSILVLQGGKSEYWKLGHLAGVIGIVLDDKLSLLIYSLMNSYKIRRMRLQKDFTNNIEKQIDAILEKIYKLGYDSLTTKEKEVLHIASKIYKEKLDKDL